jgi:hypothetical protein
MGWSIFVCYRRHMFRRHWYCGIRGSLLLGSTLLRCECCRVPHLSQPLTQCPQLYLLIIRILPGQLRHHRDPFASPSDFLGFLLRRYFLTPRLGQAFRCPG